MRILLFSISTLKSSDSLSSTTCFQRHHALKRLLSENLTIGKVEKRLEVSLSKSSSSEILTARAEIILIRPRSESSSLATGIFPISPGKNLTVGFIIFSTSTATTEFKTPLM
jgi:hypothetical protein